MSQNITALMTKGAVLFAAVFLFQVSFCQTSVNAQPPVTETEHVRAVPPAERMGPTPPFSSNLERKAARTVILDENPAAGYVDVVNYAGSVKYRTNDMVEVDVVLSKAEDDATLDRLANKIYRENDGAKYQNVIINWYVGSNPQPATPWARTSLTRTGGSIYYMDASMR